jgi:YHS domain-containing protein
MVRVDPVCGMTVVEPGALQTKFNHVRYHFCCEICRGAFLDRPGRYLKLDWCEDESLTPGEIQVTAGRHLTEDS